MSEQKNDSGITLKIRRNILGEDRHDPNKDTFVQLRTPDGRDFTVRVIDGFCDSNELKELAQGNPVLVTMPVKIEVEGGVWESKPLPLLFMHGYRNAQGTHVTRPSGIESQQITQAVVKHHEEHKLPRLKLLISCDEDGGDLRWDQGAAGRQLGVIGFAGGIDWVRSEAGTRSLVVDGREASQNPFVDAHHPNRFLVSPTLFMFKPAGGKIKI